MKKINKIIVMLVCLVLIIGAMTVSALAAKTVASGECGWDITWKLTDDGVLTISGEGEMYNYYRGGTPWYPYRTQIRKAVVEDSVMNLGGGAFDGCINLTSVTIPDHITRIEDNTFYGCTKLTNITIPPEVTKICDYAFAESGIKSIVIPNKVVEIGDHAFEKCGDLVSVEMSDSVTEMGTEVFCYCESLTDVKLSGGLTKLPMYTFYECASLNDITIPKNITTIEDFAFEKCTGMITITIPNTVTRMAQYVFLDCSSLKTVNISESITEIPSYTFRNCTSLESITIPAGITSIKEYAFFDCSSLKEVKFIGSAPTFYDHAFRGVSAQILYPDNNGTWTDLVKQNYGGTLTWKAYESDAPDVGPQDGISGTCSNNIEWTLTSDGVLTITGANSKLISMITYPWEAYNEHINTVVIKGVKEMSDYAFEELSNLKAFCVEGENAGYYSDEYGVLFKKNGVLIQAPDALAGDYIVPDNVKIINARAFKGCADMTSIILPDGLTEFQMRSFEGCTSLTRLIVPASVTRVGEEAFDGSVNLKEIWYLGKAPYMHMAHSGMTVTIYYPRGDSSWASYADESGTKTKYVAYDPEDLPLIYKKGDVNKDGDISNSDLIMVARYIVGLETDEDIKKYGDMDGNGNVNNADLVTVARIIVGIKE